MRSDIRSGDVKYQSATIYRSDDGIRHEIGVIAKTVMRAFGSHEPRMAIVWLLIDGLALRLSAPEFFHQPAFRFVAASGLPQWFWADMMFVASASLIVANLVAKPWLSATITLVAATFVMFFGLVLTGTGLKYGVISVNGCWACYIAMACYLKKPPSVVGG